MSKKVDYPREKTGGIWLWTPSFPVSAGFVYTMSSKAEKKRKVSGRGSARRRAAQAALAPQAEETTPPASRESQAEPESLKEELGRSKLGRGLEAELKRVLGLGSSFSCFCIKSKGLGGISDLPLPLGPLYCVPPPPPATLMLVLSVLKFPPSSPRAR